MDGGLAHSAAPVWQGGQNGMLTQALLDRSETGLMAFDGAKQLVLTNQAAVSMLDLVWPPNAYPVPLEQVLDRSRALAGPGRSGLQCALSDGLGRTTQLALVDGRTVMFTLAPGGAGHVVATLTVQSAPGVAAERIDGLTGLADRRGFAERLSILMASPDRQTAVLMIDLDHFRAINDTHGQEVGDSLLKLVGQRLRAAVRNADIVARLGGDEFAVAMPARDGAETRGRQLVELLSRPYLVAGHAAVIGASIGVALAPQHGTDVVSVIRAADLALAQAKADGRRTVRVFNQEMDDRVRQRHAMLEDLRRAVALQQLELHFQPQLNLHSRALIGFEALVRWRHPARGLVRPDLFIPLAEDTGLIQPIGEWVLHTACHQAMSWPGEYTVAVNVSPKQLLDGERLIRTIKAALESSELPAARLEVEITESALVREFEALEILTAIRALGVRISMDDFGTGYSSLSQLRRFPFDKLKIDRSFVRDLADSEEAASVVRAIAALGTSLGMATIAEGVETTDQEDRVRLDGCHEMQGFLVSRPVPAPDVLALIRHLDANSFTTREVIR